MAKNIELIMLEDVENLGLAGEKVQVAPGYARNYLLPRGLAAKATPGTLRLLAARKEKIEAKRAAERAAATEVANKIAALNLEIPMQSAADDQLFGSVTPRIIAERLKAEGFAVEYTKVQIDTPIKTLGEFTVVVKIYHDIKAELKLTIVRA